MANIDKQYEQENQNDPMHQLLRQTAGQMSPEEKQVMTDAVLNRIIAERQHADPEIANRINSVLEQIEKDKKQGSSDTPGHGD